MSFPIIPDITPEIDINRNDVINLLFASVAFEELGLAHIINAEAEKIQFVLGTLPDQTVPMQPSIDELLRINRSVEKTLRMVIKNQMLLQFKLENIIDIPNFDIFVNTATVTAVYNDVVLTASDSAYYHTESNQAGGVII